MTAALRALDGRTFRSLRRHRNYRLFFVGQLISVVGRQITVVALPYQVYLLSGSSLAVGSLGLVQLVPYVVFSLVAGTIADRIDRRVLLLWTQVLLAGCSALLMAGALAGHPPLWFLYVVAAVAAGISAVDQPARSATIPNLVTRSQLAGALPLNYPGPWGAAGSGPPRSRPGGAPSRRCRRWPAASPTCGGSRWCSAGTRST